LGQRLKEWIRVLTNFLIEVFFFYPSRKSEEFWKNKLARVEIK
jgi:hypothetical protein